MDLSRECPFYAVAILPLTSLTRQPFDTALVVMHSPGNRCGLIIEAHAPCYRDLQGLLPIWRECKWNPLYGAQR